MKTTFLVLLTFILLTPFTYAQKIDSLSTEIRSLEQREENIDHQIDSLTSVKSQIVDRISGLKESINLIEFQRDLEEGIPTKITGVIAMLRDEPSVAGNAIAELVNGDEVLIYDWFEKPYVRASYEGKFGYISYGSLERNEYVQSLWNRVEQKELDELNEKDPRFNILSKKYGRSTAIKIVNGEIWIGMTSEMAKDAVGRPRDINRTVNSWGVREQWVYSDGLYLYFDNGILTTIQD